METARHLSSVPESESPYERPVATVESILARVDDIADTIEFGDDEAKKTIHGYVASDSQDVTDLSRMNVTVYNSDYMHGPRSDFLVARISKRADIERDTARRMVVYVLSFDGISKELSLKRVKKVRTADGIKKLAVPCDQHQLEVVAHLLDDFTPIEE